MGFIKKLSLKDSFYEAVFTRFLTEFRKTLFIFAFQKHFLKNLKKFYFSLLQIIIFLYFQIILIR